MHPVYRQEVPVSGLVLSASATPASATPRTQVGGIATIPSGPGRRMCLYTQKGGR